MAQVRAVRRPFVSRRGRANDAHSQPTEVQPAQSQPPAVPSPPPAPEVITIDLPPLPEASDEEREAPGTGQTMIAVEAPADGTETELTATKIEADEQAEAARAELAQSTVDTSYASWTVTQLAAELKRRELPSSGTKPELVARLEASDAEQGS